MASKEGYESIPGKGRTDMAAPTKVISQQPKQLTGEEEYVLNLDPIAVGGKRNFRPKTAFKTPILCPQVVLF